MKKLLAFLILLMVGMALFAMPVVGEPPGIEAISAITVEAAQQGAFAIVTDIFPVILRAENSPFDINYFEVSIGNDNLLTVTDNDVCLFRQEAYPLYGYSKTETSAANRYIRLAIEGLP